MNFILDHSVEILAIGVAFCIYFLQKRKKELTYKIVTYSDVVSVSQDVKDEIKITYKKKPVSNLQLLIIRFTNTGNLPIKIEDYAESIKILMPDNARIITSEIIDTDSIGVKIAAELSNETKTVLKPTLLNAKDFFDIKLLLVNGTDDFLVNGRIVGVKKIRPYYTPQMEKNIERLLLGIFILILLLALAVIWGEKLGLSKDVIRVISSLAILSPFVSIAILIWRDYRRGRRV